jgi:Domain of unknown function (DUF1996)
MIVALFAAGLLLVPSANAFWRLPCSKPVMNARVDPIISPGIPSSHSHAIMGSNGAPHHKASLKVNLISRTAMGFNTTFDSLRNSECSTCQVKDDKSAYWIPELVRTSLHVKACWIRQIDWQFSSMNTRMDTSKLFPMMGCSCGSSEHVKKVNSP